MDPDLEPLERFLSAGMEEHYSEKAIEYAVNPRNVGSIDGADGFACITGPCGDTMEIWLKVTGDRVSGATFYTDGCGATIAAGSMVTELAKGKTTAEAQRIGQQEIMHALHGLPEDHQHCALLAANTLKGALADFRAMQKEPWKKAYRK